ncbi:MAG: hypothetical protein IT355_17110 [Gemmatimonadaceae bacterium]|nr:hypothetical protein [Gemmatimonadaceae bacterium]
MPRALTAHRRTCAALGLIVAGTAASLGAQAPDTAAAPAITVDAHWLPYLGCWETTVDGLRGPMTCLLSTDDPRIVDLMTVAGDSATMRERFDLTGRPVALERDGCTGTQVTGWLLNERSFQVRTEFTCADSVTQQSTSVFTMRTEGSFVRVQAMKRRGTTAVRIIEHRLAADTRAVSAAVLRRVPNPDGSVVRTARSTALASLTAGDVLDATQLLDPALVEAWIAGHGQKVLFGARDLRSLRAAGVPERVLDMMIAVSSPGTFTLSPRGEPVVRERVALRQPARERAVANAAMLAGLGTFGCGGYGGMYMSASCSPSYSCYLGYGSYGSAWGGWNDSYCYNLSQYRQAYVVYPDTWVGGGTPNANPPASASPPSRVVNGRGYSQGAVDGDGRTARPVQSVGSSVGSVGYSGAAAAGGGTAVNTSTGGSGSASGEGAAQRTAKERP